MNILFFASIGLCKSTLANTTKSSIVANVILGLIGCMY